MSDPLAAQIEQFLLDRGDWVPVSEICQRFALPERRLRALGDRDGLLDHCAISDSKRGLIHIGLVNSRDYRSISGRLLRHGVREIRKVRNWRAARHRQRRGIPPMQYTLEGQALLGLRIPSRT